MIHTELGPDGAAKSEYQNKVPSKTFNSQESVQVWDLRAAYADVVGYVVSVSQFRSALSIPKDLISVSTFGGQTDTHSTTDSGAAAKPFIQPGFLVMEKEKKYVFKAAGGKQTAIVIYSAADFNKLMSLRETIHHAEPAGDDDRTSILQVYAHVTVVLQAIHAYGVCHNNLAGSIMFVRRILDEPSGVWNAPESEDATAAWKKKNKDMLRNIYSAADIKLINTGHVTVSPEKKATTCMTDVEAIKALVNQDYCNLFSGNSGSGLCTSLKAPPGEDEDQLKTLKGSIEVEMDKVKRK